MSSSKKTTTQNFTNTTTPTNPEWVTGPLQNQMGRLDVLAASDPYSYVAGPSALQNQQFDIASGLGASAPGWINNSANIAQGLGSYTPQTVTAQSVDPTQAFASLGAANPTGALTNLLSGRPDNPYLAAMNQANIDQSLQGYNDALGSAAKTLTRSVLPGIRSGGILSGQYGGSRQGIAEGVALGDLSTQLGQNARNLAQSAMDSGNQLYGGAYENAQGRMSTTANGLAGLAIQNSQQNASNNLQAQMANQSAGLQGANLNLNAAQYLGGLGQYGLNALSQGGTTQQGLAQQYAQAPLNLAQQMSQNYGSLPLNLFNGKSETGSSKAKESSFSVGLDDALKVIALSDPRVKRDVEPVGPDPQGRNVYDYNYIWDGQDAPRRTGYMADEVALTDPDALAIDEHGIGAVDYARIGEKNAAALATGLRPITRPRLPPSPTTASRMRGGLFGGAYDRWLYGRS